MDTIAAAVVAVAEGTPDKRKKKSGYERVKERKLEDPVFCEKHLQYFKEVMKARYHTEEGKLYRNTPEYKARRAGINRKYYESHPPKGGVKDLKGKSAPPTLNTGGSPRRPPSACPPSAPPRPSASWPRAGYRLSRPWARSSP